MNAQNSPSAAEIMTRLAFVMNARLEERAAEAELSIQQVRLLGILRDREPTINELAAHVGTDKSSMSGAVVRAERRGLVSRIPDDADGRAVRVHLEPAGRALVEAASLQYEADVSRIFEDLTGDERAQWVALTIRLLVAEARERGGVL